MNAIAALELQSALIARLQADPVLQAMPQSVKVYDHVPRRAAYPYITLANMETFDWSTQEKDGAEHIITLNVWSKHRGRKQACEIIDIVHEALDGAPMVITGQHLINFRVIFWTVTRDLDGEAYRGTLRLRAVTEPVT